MHVTVLEPVGAIVDSSLRRLDPGSIDELVRLLATHGSLVFPDQHLDDHGFVAFLRLVGDLMFTTGETPVPGFDDLNIVTNVGRTTPPRSTFHTDTSYVSVPPAYTALRIVDVPESGGETLFTNQYRAYDTLPDDVRTHLDGRTITHVVTGLELDPEVETVAEHRVFRRHPVSGRVALFLSTPQRCVSVSGMDEHESHDTVSYLFEHSTCDDNVMRHAWSPGDVVMWDNGCVLHRADHSDVVGDRTMHRGMVAAHMSR